MSYSKGINPHRLFSVAKNKKESDLSHQGDQFDILCGHFNGMGKGYPLPELQPTKAVKEQVVGGRLPPEKI